MFLRPSHLWRCAPTSFLDALRNLLVWGQQAISYPKIPGSPASSPPRAWKFALHARLCERHGLTVIVAHYPSGASKWNPIEHRLFSEISKNWAAEPLNSYEKMLKFIRTTSTQTGLVVTTYLDRNEYPTRLKPDPLLISSLRLTRGKVLPRWNYTIRPNL